MTGVRLFQLGGVSVTANVWFLVLVAFFGASAGSLRGGLIWVLGIFVSLLVHEFGHALIAKGYGLRPRIVLHGWGGLCHHAPARTAGQDIFITAAGPGAGLLFAAVIYGLLALSGPPGAEGLRASFLMHFLAVLLTINVFWSLANLIPLWPLDGGQILQVFLRTRLGSRRGDRVTHMTGLTIGGGLLFYALFSGSFFLVIILGFLLYENVKKLQPSALTGRTYGQVSYGAHGGGGGALAFDWRPTPMVRRLLWIMGGIWAGAALVVLVADKVSLVTVVYDLCHLHWSESVTDLKVWQFFTYMWLHDLGAMAHIFGNLFGLWILGSILERRLGPRGFFRLTLQLGIGAGIFTVLMGWFFPATFGQPVVGASGAIIGMVAAVSILMPEEKLLLFFVAPIRAKWLVWIVLAIDTMAFASNPESDLAWHTHMGGALSAWLVINRFWDVRLILDKARLFWIGRGRRRPKRPDLKVLPGGKNGPPTLH